MTVDRLGDLEEVLESLEELSLLGKLKKFEDKGKEYKSLLLLISRALDCDERHLERLIDICRRKTSVYFGGNIVNVGASFKELESRRFLGFRHHDILKEILTEIEREDLLAEIEDFEKRRNKTDAFERNKAQVVALAKGVGGRLMGVLNIKTACKVARMGLMLFTLRELLNRCTTYDQLFNFFEDCVLPADTQLIDVRGGCVCFTVQAGNRKGLTTLWQMYRDGTLKSRLYNLLVTDEMKNFAGGEENVELDVTIDEKEYEEALIELINATEGDGWTPQVIGRRLSDSVLSVGPKEGDASLTRLTQLEHTVRVLEERIEILERESRPPDEFWETASPMDEIPDEQAQYVNYQRLGIKHLSEDKWEYIKAYVDHIEVETESLITDTSDSGMGTQGTPSERGLDTGRQYI